MRVTEPIPRCPICRQTMKVDQPEWVHKCPSCGYLRSTLTPTISQSPEGTTIDEEHRAHALDAIRRENFQRILHFLGKESLPSRALLEVGCAHGWFLQAAQQCGYEVYGLEPDPMLGALAQQSNLPVWIGFFPDYLPSDRQFDIIVFNDVFEHLLDVAGAMMTCANLLRPNGVLIINLPVSSGIFYRVAVLLRHLGYSGPFDRMWQRHFPSPHISYFRPSQLQILATQYGLTEIRQATLPSVSRRGLWHRLRYDTSTSIFVAALVYCGVMFVTPFLHYLPADISVHFFRKPA